MSMQHWAELVKATGLLSRDMDAVDIYQLGGRVIHDDLLTKRALKFLRGSVLPAGSRLRAIQEMTEPERQALRERVSGNVVQFIHKESENKNSAEQIAREAAKEEALLEPEEENEL